MKTGVALLAAGCLAGLLMGCTSAGGNGTGLYRDDSIDAAEETDGTSLCPQADGGATVAPSISVFSILFVVNGVEQLVGEGDRLQVLPGEEVHVREVTICAEPFSGDGGEVCVDFAPISEAGREVASEHRGTHLVRVTPGLTTLAGFDFSWTWDGSWSGIAAMVNHWPPNGTADMACASGQCEHDDRVVIGQQ